MLEAQEEFYTCEHQNHTIFAAPEDSANACRFEEYADDEDERCFVYTVRFCKKCSEIIWEDLGSVPEGSSYPGEMNVERLIKLGYFKDGRTECAHLI